MNYTMTSPTKINEIFYFIIFFISIYMVSISNFIFIANFTRCVSVFFCEFSKKYNISSHIRVFINGIINILTFLRTKFTTLMLNLIGSYKKVFITIFARMYRSFDLIYSKTFLRTIFLISMFKNFMSKSNFLITNNTIRNNSFNFKSIVSTFLRTKSFFLIFNSTRLNEILSSTNSTYFMDFSRAKCDLALFRTKQIFTQFNLIWINIYRFFALRTLCDHKRKNTRLMSLMQDQNVGAGV